MSPLCSVTFRNTIQRSHFATYRFVNFARNKLTKENKNPTIHSIRDCRVPSCPRSRTVRSLRLFHPANHFLINKDQTSAYDPSTILPLAKVPNNYSNTSDFSKTEPRTEAKKNRECRAAIFQNASKTQLTTAHRLA